MGFVDESVRELHIAALELFINAAKPNPVSYVSELFVSDRYRQSGFALSLVLSVHSIGAIHGWQKGITFATTEHNASKLFLRMGGYKLSLNKAQLPVFYCENQQVSGQLMGLKIREVKRPIFGDVIREIQIELEAKMVLEENMRQR